MTDFHECNNPCPDHPDDKNHEHCDWCNAMRDHFERTWKADPPATGVRRPWEGVS